MGEEKPSFWTTIPGILTGAAAIITALASLIVGVGNKDQASEPGAAGQAPPTTAVPQTPSTAARSPMEWPLVGEEAFTGATPSWPRYDLSSEHYVQLTIGPVGGKYRWELLPRQAWEMLVEAPYGPELDFYVAVDARFVQADPAAAPPYAALLFGRASNADYGFKISQNGSFALGRADQTSNRNVIDWTPLALAPNQSHRLAVAVDRQDIKLYIDGNLVGSYRDPAFTGGKVGLAVTASGAAVIDFDNFEFRRKPD